MNLFKVNHLLFQPFFFFGGGRGGGLGVLGQFHIVRYTERLNPKGVPTPPAPINRLKL